MQTGKSWYRHIMLVGASEDFLILERDNRVWQQDTPVPNASNHCACIFYAVCPPRQYQNITNFSDEYLARATQVLTRRALRQVL